MSDPPVEVLSLDADPEDRADRISLEDSVSSGYCNTTSGDGHDATRLCGRNTASTLILKAGAFFEDSFPNGSLFPKGVLLPEGYRSRRRNHLSKSGRLNHLLLVTGKDIRNRRSTGWCSAGCCSTGERSLVRDIVDNISEGCLGARYHCSGRARGNFDTRHSPVLSPTGLLAAGGNRPNHNGHRIGNLGASTGAFLCSSGFLFANATHLSDLRRFRPRFFLRSGESLASSRDEQGEQNQDDEDCHNPPRQVYTTAGSSITARSLRLLASPHPLPLYPLPGCRSNRSLQLHQHAL